MHHAAAFPGDDLIIKREPIFQKNRINFRKLLVQNTVHCQLIHVDVESEGGGKDTHSFENSLAFHKVELKLYLAT